MIPNSVFSFLYLNNLPYLEYTNHIKSIANYVKCLQSTLRLCLKKSHVKIRRWRLYKRKRNLPWKKKIRKLLSNLNFFEPTRILDVVKTTFDTQFISGRMKYCHSLFCEKKIGFPRSAYVKGSWSSLAVQKHSSLPFGCPDHLLFPNAIVLNLNCAVKACVRVIQIFYSIGIIRTHV